YLEPSSHARSLLGMWGHLVGREAAQAVLAARFSRAPHEAARFIGAMAGQPWRMETELAFSPRIEREEYDAIMRLVGAETVIDALWRSYGDAVDDLPDDDIEEASASRNPPELLLARRFTHLHRSVEARETHAAEGSDEASGTGTGDMEDQAEDEIAS